MNIEVLTGRDALPPGVVAVGSRWCRPKAARSPGAGGRRREPVPDGARSGVVHASWVHRQGGPDPHLPGRAPADSSDPEIVLVGRGHARDAGR